MRRVLTSTIAACLGAALTAAQAPLPDRDIFMTRVRSALRLDDDLQKDFAYNERRRDVKIGPLGKVTVGPLRTFEVFPAAAAGPSYKRLVAIDGVPLDPLELRRRDGEREREVETETRRQRRESPEQREARAERAARTRRDGLTILADALAVFEPTITSRDLVHGIATIVVSMTPRPAVRVATREGGWMKQFQGRVWFVEEDGQFARLDMQATDDVSIGWGIVGRLHKGSRLVVERRPAGPVWLPARLTFDATGRTLMFRPFEMHVVREYSDYRPK